jgi:hypothetical protein
MVVAVVSRTLLLVWDVSADQEEPWRRLLQELSDADREEEEYAGSLRRLGVLAESVWLVHKPLGGGMAVVYLEALGPSGRCASLRHLRRRLTRGTAQECASFSASLWRGYHEQRAASSFSCGAMMMIRASVRRRKTRDPTPQLAKDGNLWSIRREDLLEVRTMQEAIVAGEAARVLEQMNARTPLVDLRTSAKEETKPSQKRASKRTGKGWSPPTLPSTSKITTNESRCDVHD